MPKAVRQPEPRRINIRPAAAAILLKQELDVQTVFGAIGIYPVVLLIHAGMAGNVNREYLQNLARMHIRV